MLEFPSRFPSGISGKRLEYAEHQNVLKYHSKENANNVSVGNVSVVSILISLL